MSHPTARYSRSLERRRLSLLVAAGAIALTFALLHAGAALAVTKGQISAFGSAGTGNGQFGFTAGNVPLGANGIAVNRTGAGGVGAGDVYVVDAPNNRVQRFTADGDFVSAFGAGGATGGQFATPQGIAVDQASGAVYVTDRGNARVQKFTAQGTFLRTWGWGVLDGGANFQICTSSQSCRAGVSGSGVGAGAGLISSAVEGSPRVAVDPLDGSVYVTDPGNRRVQVFDSSGNFVRGFGWGVVDGTSAFQVCTVVTGCRGAVTTAGTENGRFGSNQPSRIAIDAIASPHILYLSDSNVSNRVQRIDITNPAAPAPLAAIAVPPLLSAPTVGLAVDTSSGNLLVGRDPTGTAETVVQEIGNPANTIAPLPAVVDTHAAGEGWVGSSTTTGAGLVADVAINPVSGRIYVSRPGVNQVAVLNQPGSQPTVTGPTVSNNTSGTAATLNGSVNPNGSLTIYRFEYRLCPGGVCGSGTFTSVPVPDAPVGSGNGPVAVARAVSGLTPGATYETRLTADGFGAPVSTALAPFSTPSVKPSVVPRPAAPLTDTTAELQAGVNPNGQATAYRFEWGAADCAASACTSVPVPDEEIGSGTAEVVVTQLLTGLTPETTYHFRIVAVNATGTESGPDQTFTTKSPEGSTVPPERGYEMVTPTDKPGGQGVGAYFPGGDADSIPGRASVNGDRYLTSSFAGNLVPGSFLYAEDRILSERTDNGWVSRSAFTHKEYSRAGGSAASLLPEAVSPDLGTIGWRTQGSTVALFPEMASWTALPTYVSDWQGRWELLGPKQSTNNPGLGSNYAIAADGSNLLYDTLQGQLGPGDPTLTQVPNSQAVYENRRFGPLSDTFVPNAELTPVAICTGGGAERTQIPLREPNGKLGAQACPPPSYAGEQVLVSDFGASISRGISSSNLMPFDEAMSADGRRMVFNSPDPGVSGSPASCTGTGTETVCPTQVFIRSLDEAGSPTVRWISRPQVSGQSASLLGKAIFEGASRDGRTVFFRTNSPLSADDPNGTGSAPVTEGSPGAASWDLYQYRFPSTGDPGDGSLIRISAGPQGNGDCNVSAGGAGGGLRFASDDGSRAYFVCAGTLAGVPTNSSPSDGTITSASGTAATTTATRNLYYYDAGKPPAQRWEFVAQLPATGAPYASCATTGTNRRFSAVRNGSGTGYTDGGDECVGGTADGRFFTFMTAGKLVAGDPEPGSVDIYGFDASADRLTRISASQGGAGGTYGCLGPHTAPTGFCNADVGFSNLSGVATAPSDPDDRIAYFQSRSKLVPEDVNDQYDVYEWRNGVLSLLSAGAGSKGSYYAGNGATGKDVFVETRDQLTWEDVDAVMDIYDARVGGGFPEPPAPPAECDALADGCQAGPVVPPALGPPASSGVTGQGNVAEPAPRPKKCRKGFVRRGGKCVRKKHGKKQRQKQRTGRNG